MEVALQQQLHQRVGAKEAIEDIITKVATKEMANITIMTRKKRPHLPDGVPRSLRDVVICPQVVGDEWRWPLVHGILHVLGLDHGDAMERREQEILGGAA